jgi:hypothetical protein
MEETEYYSDGSLKHKDTYRYKFDDNDNWTERIKYEENKAKDVEITERTIEYYE